MAMQIEMQPCMEYRHGYLSRWSRSFAVELQIGLDCQSQSTDITTLLKEFVITNTPF